MTLTGDGQEVVSSDGDWLAGARKAGRCFRDFAQQMRAKLLGVVSTEFSWRAAQEQLLRDWGVSLSPHDCEVIRSSLATAFMGEPAEWFAHFDVLPDMVRERLYELVFFRLIERFYEAETRGYTLQHKMKLLVWLTYLFERSSVSEDLGRFWTRFGNRKMPASC